MRRKRNQLWAKWLSIYESYKWRQDPVAAHIFTLFHGRAGLAAFFVGVTQVVLWWGIGKIIIARHPFEKFSSPRDMDEFAFGLFVWGMLIPTLWYFYLSGPSWWRRTIFSLHLSRNVDGSIKTVVQIPNVTPLALLIGIVGGISYILIDIPAEIAAGRFSFWFMEPWSKAIIVILLSLTYYVGSNFLIQTLLFILRFYHYFQKRGSITFIVFMLMVVEDLGQ